MAKYPKWSEEEHFYLETLVSFHPLQDLVILYQRKAKKEGWPYRSMDAIKVKVTRKIGSIKATDKNFTYHALAEILGYNRYRVREWYRAGMLKAVKVGYLTKVTPTALNQFAAQYPSFLAEANFDGLVFLFGEKRAKEIKAIAPSKRGFPRPIRCLTTGVVWPSLKKAAKENYMDKDTMRRRADQQSGFCWAERERTA